MAREHAESIIQQLDSVEQTFERERTSRLSDAIGHLMTAEAVAAAEIDPSRLADKRTEAVVVLESPGRAVVHLRQDQVAALRRKVESYGDESRLTPNGHPLNEPLVAALERIRRSTLADLSEGAFAEDTVDHKALYWVELWANGGRLSPAAEQARVRREVLAFAALYGVDERRVRAFRATERDIYLLRLSGAALVNIPLLAPDIYAVVPARGELRDVHVLDYGRELVSKTVPGPPNRGATTVVVMDTGVAANHPLLAAALLGPGASVLVDDSSPQDAHGHGTEMAGLAAYADLGAGLLDEGVLAPRNWLQNVRLLAQDQLTDDQRPFWPERTQEAVLAAEQTGRRRRVFNLSIGAPNPESQGATSWSVATDLLAYNEGRGRILVVAAGTVAPSGVPEHYPNLNLASALDDPAQAPNVISVGAVTDRAAIPKDPVYGTVRPLALEGQLSPYSACDIGGARPIKPEIVVEGGNCAPDGDLAGAGIESLSVLTTAREHLTRGPLTVTWGTSAAAASASGMVGEVWEANPGRRPETIRALLVHSARWSEEMKSQMPSKVDRLRSFGYGRPDPVAASWSARRRPTLIVEDRLRPGKDVAGGQTGRDVLFYQLPLPSAELLALGETPVDLTVTLSYFLEPNEANRRKYAGAGLRWDMQGQVEDEITFRRRINKLDRPVGYKSDTSSYPWEIGPDTRSRGSVQADRCRITAASLAGNRVIAVFPTLGWWEGRAERISGEIPFALVVTVDAGEANIDLYSLIEAAISVPVTVQRR
jgi:hypothetical protein